MSIMDDMETGEDIPHRADDGYLEWWHASVEIRDGCVRLTVTMGGFRQDDVPLEVARRAVGFWAKALG